MTRDGGAVRRRTDQILLEAGLNPSLPDEALLEAVGYDRLSVMEVIRCLENAGASSFTGELIECLRTLGDLRYFALTKMEHGS